jgi:hypothetical protein
MIGWILAFMAYDTVKTIDNNLAREEKRKKLKELEWRLSTSVTRDHLKKCICRLCVTRRTNLTNEYNRLLAEK